MFEERARAQRQELVRDSAYAACNNDRVAGPDEFLARPRLAIKTMPNSLFPAFSHCPHYGCYSFGFRNPTDADSHETQLHPGERLQRLADQRAKSKGSELAPRKHCCQCCPCSFSTKFSSRTFLEKHQEAYDHQSESKVTRDTNALKRKTVPFARTKASKAAAVAQPISKKPRLADSPMPPLRHPTDAVPSAAPDREPAATPPPPPFAAAARAAAAPAPAAHSASNFAASGEAEDDAIVSDPGSLSRIHTLSKYPLSRLVSLAAPEVKAKDNGKRPNTMEDRWDNQLSTAVLSGDKCVYCLLPTGDDDKLCDNGREGNQCRLSFHDLCYKQHWNEIKAYKKCICRHCAVCTCGLVLRKEVVGDCSICNANMHLECARKLDFYCIGCHHAVWPL